MLTTDNLALRKKVLELLHADKVEEAMELCNRSQGPVSAILAVGLRRFLLLRRLNYDPARIEEQVVKAMDDYGVHIVAAMERHLPILSNISAVAPMVGSVGTVVGMVILFQDIAAKAGSENIVKAAAAGIQVKLLVTVWGLLVGIPAYIAFNYFTTDDQPLRPLRRGNRDRADRGRDSEDGPARTASEDCRGARRQARHGSRPSPGTQGSQVIAEVHHEAKPTPGQPLAGRAARGHAHRPGLQPGHFLRRVRLHRP